MNQPLVTVIVPTYNRAGIIGETIGSILGQTYREIELLVVADGCTDDTPGVVASFNDPRARLMSQPGSGGPAAPRNAAAAVAKGKYIAFCDDDDLWEPRKLELQIALMERERDLALTYTKGVNFGAQGELPRQALPIWPAREHFRALLYGNFIVNTSVVVRREVLLAMGRFDESVAMRGSEDYQMWLRIARRHRIAGVDEPLYRYRLHGTNLMGKRSVATLRSMKLLRDLRTAGVIDRPLFLPLAWMRIKWLVYILMGR